MKEFSGAQKLKGLPILVTGGSGFIGSHLVEALRRKDANVLNLDLRPPNFDSHRPMWVEGDLMDRTRVCELLRTQTPSVIYNLAANADISQGMGAMRVNVEGLQNIVLASDGEFRPRIVHVSTQLVAGAAEDAFDPREFEPYTAYGESKAASERLLHENPDVNWVIVRPTTIWGPYHPTFPTQIWRYLRQGFYLHPTGPSIIRSYGYVGNVVHQLVRAAELDEAAVAGKTFYVGDEPIDSGVFLNAFSIALRGKPVRRMPVALLKVAAELGELSGRLGGPSPINRGRIYRMTKDYPVPMAPTFTVLGRGPHSLERGIEATVAWLNGNAHQTRW